MNHDIWIGRTLGNLIEYLIEEDNGRYRYAIGLYYVNRFNSSSISLNNIIDLCIIHDDNTYIDRYYNKVIVSIVGDSSKGYIIKLDKL